MILNSVIQDYTKNLYVTISKIKYYCAQLLRIYK